MFIALNLISQRIKVLIGTICSADTKHTIPYHLKLMNHMSKVIQKSSQPSYLISCQELFGMGRAVVCGLA